jgi:hypothetical protein
MAKDRKKAEAKPGSLARMPKGYQEFVASLKDRIRAAQLRAAFAVNWELLALYWHIGKSIVERQRAESWGNAVIERLSKDLQTAFPGISGFSRPNVYRMRAFFLAYAGGEEIVSQPGRTTLVCLHSPRTRLEPQRPRPSDRHRSLPPSGESHN